MSDTHCTVCREDYPFTGQQTRPVWEVAGPGYRVCRRCRDAGMQARRREQADHTPTCRKCGMALCSSTGSCGNDCCDEGLQKALQEVVQELRAAINEPMYAGTRKDWQDRAIRAEAECDALKAEHAKEIARLTALLEREHAGRVEAVTFWQDAAGAADSALDTLRAEHDDYKDKWLRATNRTNRWVALMAEHVALQEAASAFIHGGDFEPEDRAVVELRAALATEGGRP